MIDAGKIRETGSLELIAEKYVEKIKATDVDGGKQFDVVLLPIIVDEMKSEFLNDSSNNQNSLTVEVEFIYNINIISRIYLLEILNSTTHFFGNINELVQIVSPCDFHGRSKQLVNSQRESFVCVTAITQNFQFASEHSNQFLLHCRGRLHLPV